jgi:hypothetical protein
MRGAAHSPAPAPPPPVGCGEELAAQSPHSTILPSLGSCYTEGNALHGAITLSAEHAENLGVHRPSAVRKMPATALKASSTAKGLQYPKGTIPSRRAGSKIERQGEPTVTVGPPTAPFGSPCKEQVFTGTV